MALTAESSDRRARLRNEHADRLIERWTEIVAASLRGRPSKAELATSCAPR